MVDLRIDNFGEEYVEAYINFHQKRHGRVYDEGSIERVLKTRRKSPSAYTLLFLDESIIGETVHIIDGDVLTIAHFNILEKFQGRRYGSKLIDYICERYQKLEILISVNVVADDNLYGYYESLGFEKLSECFMRYKK